MRKQKDTSTQSTEVPLVFIDVEAIQATKEVPEQAKYYSSVNSIAGNPDTQVDAEVPKISGTQEVVPKTTDTPRKIEKTEPEPMPLQPSPVTAEPAPDLQPVKPEPVSKVVSKKEAETGPGDVVVSKPAQRPIFPKPAITPAAQRPRYRRLADARAADTSLAGEKMKQEGGVKRYSIAEGLDAKATPFGAYDRAIIDAIQKRWFDLLDERNYARNASGKVVLTFRLNSDGSVTELSVSDSQVSEILSILCQRAVQDPSPYAPWPADMRRAIGDNHRLVRFTFHYE